MKLAKRGAIQYSQNDLFGEREKKKKRKKED